MYAPDERPSVEEACNRYRAYYGGKRALDPSDPFCQEMRGRMRDISWFMHALQQQFSSWYNRTRENRRWGGLWADRYKHTLLGDACAVWECCKYVQMNPVRAKMVKDPGGYRFSSYGTWCGRGRHPFEENVLDVLLPWLEGLYPFREPKTLREAMRQAFSEVTGMPEEESDGRVRAFRIEMDRRVRYWVDGLVIGSELFIDEMMARYSSALRKQRRGISRARSPDEKPLPLCCYKQLRSI